MHLRMLPAMAFALSFFVITSPASAEPFEYVSQIFLQELNAYYGFGRNTFIADFNEDQSSDLLVSEGSWGENAAGRVHVFLSVDGIDSGTYEMATYQSDITFIGEADDCLGCKLQVCDLNGDGVSDVLFNRWNFGGNAEYLFVFYGGEHWTSGTVITDVEAEADVVIIPDSSNETRFHYPFVCEDVNGDGYDDILAGAQPVVILGDDYPSGTWIDLDVDLPAVRFVFHGFSPSRKYLADITGDGNLDYVFSDSGDSTYTGIIRTWFGFDDYSTPRVIDMDVTPADVVEEGPYMFAWYSVRDVGDWNGDGADDLLVYQDWSTELDIFRLNLGENGMQPGHEFDMQFYIWTPNASITFADMDGDSQLDLANRAMEFYWDRTAFPQEGNWELGDYDPQGIYQGNAWVGLVETGNLDNDGITDVIFHDNSFVDIYLSSRTGDDDDNDTGPDDDDTGDDDTGPDDDDDDTGPDDDDDNDTGPDDDDDTEPDDDDDDDTGPDDDDDGCCG